MDSNKITTGAVALILGLSTALAGAQPHDRDHNRGKAGLGPHGQAHGHVDHGQDGRPGPNRRRGAGPDHRFHKGDRLPNQWRGRQYVVEDWRGHHLKRPPRGYHWVQTGSDYVLVAIATGVIAQIILSQ